MQPTGCDRSGGQSGDAYAMPIVTLYEFIGREAASCGRRVRQQAIISAMRNLLLVCAVFIAAAAQPLCAQQGGARPTPPAMPDAPPAATGAGPGHENLVYSVADGQTLLLDIFEPTNNDGLPRPAIILIHGGAWTSFDKSTMRQLAQFLAVAGFVAIPVDYRLFHDDLNRWPAQLDDVQRAVRWVRANSSKYNVDRNHIGAYGHSAEAQLALMLGMMETRDNSDPALAKYSSKVQAVVEASGPTDLAAQSDPDGMMFVASFLGGDYATHPELWRDASPISHVAKSNAPILIIHGTRDEMVPFAQAEALNDALKKAGADVKFLRLDSDHMFSDPAAHRQLVLETQAFLFRHLASAP
jgi:acetyl esterase/lipase